MRRDKLKILTPALLTPAGELDVGGGHLRGVS